MSEMKVLQLVEFVPAEGERVPAGLAAGKYVVETGEMVTTKREVYVDSKTGSVYDEPGKGREKAEREVATFQPNTVYERMEVLMPVIGQSGVIATIFDINRALLTAFSLGNTASRSLAVSELKTAWKEHEGASLATEALAAWASTESDLAALLGLAEAEADLDGDLSEIKKVTIMGTVDGFPVNRKSLKGANQVEGKWVVCHELDDEERKLYGERLATSMAMLEQARSLFWEFAAGAGFPREDGVEVELSRDGAFEFTGKGKVAAHNVGSAKKSTGGKTFTVTATIKGQTYTVSGPQRGLVAELADSAGVSLGDKDAYWREDGGNRVYNLRNKFGENTPIKGTESIAPDWVDTLTITVS